MVYIFNTKFVRRQQEISCKHQKVFNIFKQRKLNDAKIYFIRNIFILLTSKYLRISRKKAYNLLNFEICLKFYHFYIQYIFKTSIKINKLNRGSKWMNLNSFACVLVIFKVTSVTRRSGNTAADQMLCERLGTVAQKACWALLQLVFVYIFVCVSFADSGSDRRCRGRTRAAGLPSSCKG